MEEEKKFGAGSEGKEETGKRDRRSRNKGRGKYGKPGKPGNDMAYWDKYSELMDVATQVPWNYIPGTEIEIPNVANQKIRFHNVLTVEYISTIGISKVATDPFNLQMRKTWLDMHRKYRGLGSYQQADLGIVLFCVKEVFDGLGECSRIYGIYNSYPVANRILPRGILRAIGYNATLLTSIENNLADFLYGVNRLIRKARQLCLPKNLTVLRNQLGLVMNLYTDSKDKRASIINFKPSGYWTYKASALSSGSAAYMKPLTRSDSSAYGTYDAFLKYFEDMIDVLLADDDVTTICSDLLAAYGDDGVEGLLPFEQNYAVIPVYDESILLKVHNMEICGGANLFGSNLKFVCDFMSNADLVAAKTDEAISNATWLWITQSDNNAVFLPRLVCQNGPSTYSAELHDPLSLDQHYPGPATAKAITGSSNAGFVHLYDTWEEQPSKACVCESTLWKFNCGIMISAVKDSDSSTVTQGSFPINSCATELIIDAQINKVINSDIAAGAIYNLASVLTGAMMNTSEAMGITHFDWFPLRPHVTATIDASGGNTHAVDDVLGDIDNFAVFGSSVVKKIHDAALLSGFAIDATLSK